MATRDEKLDKARETPGDHAGPHGSYPIKDAESVKAAWDLAGHAANPDEVRSNIKRIAAEKGLSHALPSTAHDTGHQQKMAEHNSAHSPTSEQKGAKDTSPHPALVQDRTQHTRTY